MNYPLHPSRHVKPTASSCCKLTAAYKLWDLGKGAQISGWLLALLLAIGTLPSAGQMANASNGKFLGNILRATTTLDTNFLTYWNQVTPENSGKWDSVEATRDVMNWTQLDFIYNYTRARGIPFKQHTFVWGQQSPVWMTSLSHSEQRGEVEEWIAAFAARYPNTEFIDVVNEPLHAPAEYREALGGSGATGWDWVIWSFEKARLYFPNAKLLLNDYNILNSDSETTQYLTIINLLKDRGLIDGIGEQAHFYEYTPISTITNNLNRLAATGLPIYISEFDLSFADDTEQLNRYQALFPVFWTNPAVRGITFWGYIQGQIWRSDAYLLRANRSERPALSWVKNYVAANPQSLNVSVTSPANGQRMSDTSMISASASITYGTAPFTVTFQKKLNHEVGFTSISSDSSAPYTAELGILPVGTYQIRAIVTDSKSRTNTSPANTFTVSQIKWLGISGSWNAPATWFGGIIADGMGNTVNFTGVNIDADRTITSNSDRTVGSIIFNDDTTSSHNLTLAGTSNLTLDLVVGAPVINVPQADRTLSISSRLAGSDGLQKTGAGTLTLSGDNTYTGATNIGSGILRLEGNAFSTMARDYVISSGAVLHQSGNSQIPSGNTTITGGGTLRASFSNGIGPGSNLNLSMGAGALIDIPSSGSIFNGGWQAIQWTNNQATLNVGGTLSIWDGQAITADALTGAGMIDSTANGGSSADFTLGVNNGSGTFSGNITAAGTRVISLVKNGTGTQIFSGATTFQGTTTVNAGTLQFAKTQSLYNGSSGNWSKTKITVNNGGTIALNVGGTNEFTTGNVTTLLANLGGAVNNNGLRAGSSIAFDTTNSSSGTFTLSNSIGNTSGPGGGAVGLSKFGMGTLIVSNTNTYTGPTRVNEGTLVVTGASQSTRAITVSANGSMGLAIGSPVTALSATVNLSGSIHVFGSPTLPSYTLLNALSINGTLELDPEIPGYSLVIEGGEILKLNSTATPYDVWAAINAPTGGPDDDFDGDLVLNAIEFVLGGDKDTNDFDKLPSVSTDGTKMAFHFVRDQTSIHPKIALAIETSANLTTWNISPSPYSVSSISLAQSPGVAVVKDSPTSGKDTVTLTVAQDSAAKFARLKVMIEP